MPARIASALAFVSDDVKNRATEIRLRDRLPLSLSVGDVNLMIDERGRVTEKSPVRATGEELSDCVYNLCRGSVHSYIETIANGYIPYGNGGRAGVAATVDNGQLRAVSSLCLRIPRDVRARDGEILRHYAANGICGTLIIAPPASGKTTMLRSLALSLSEKRRVCVIDSRNEIFGVRGAEGYLDVVRGYGKAEGIELAVRCLSPEVVVCDEISQRESDAVFQASNAGIPVIASAHGSSLAELKQRRGFSAMIGSMFGLFVFLSVRNGVYAAEIAEGEAVC